MCGIFGVVELSWNRENNLLSIFESLVLHSESRGREASGFLLSDKKHSIVYKSKLPGTELLKEKDVVQGFSAISHRHQSGERLCLMGHSRLVTNGSEDDSVNNQPVVLSSLVGIHNGIVTNDKALIKSKAMACDSELDSEVLFRIIEESLPGSNSLDIDELKESLDLVKGTINIAVAITETNEFLLYSNHGSLYFFQDKSFLIFASERAILEKVLYKIKVSSELIKQLELGSPLIVDFDYGNKKVELFDQFKVDGNHDLVSMPQNSNYNFSLKLNLHISSLMSSLSKLRRCTKCVLPETMPFIEFDGDGVCNYCNNHELIQVKGDKKLLELADGFRAEKSRPDVVVALSGGRDSTFGLHYTKNILGLNPVAYTYDWGMVSDEARKTSANICGKLGVEHIIVSADIRKKRSNIGKNINAWLKKPDLGMIPLFMAGDKQFYYYAEKIRKQVGASTVLFSAGNELERTDFKNGFCGIKSGGESGLLASIALQDKARLVRYYMKNFICNPEYINSSIFDTAYAFLSTYVMKHNFHYIYHYHKWDENEIMKVLIEEYDWVAAKDTKNSWRIGDGTSAFYNYIYLNGVGFTEHDTFKSNQIREGILTREEVISDISNYNFPRIETIKNYLDMVGVDFDGAIEVINSLSKWTRNV